MKWKFCKKNKAVVCAIIIVVGLLVAGGIFYAKSGGFFLKDKMSAQAAGLKLINFLNESTGTTTASLVSVSETNGVYKITLKYDGSEYESYITRDGKLFFQYGYALDQNSQNNNQESAEITKTDRPEVKLFVMSFCPFGNQAEDTMLPVYNLLKDKVDWKIHYIVSVSNDEVNSLHGQKEVDQNEREACVLQDSGLAKWWLFTTYVNNKCGSDGSCWEDAAQSSGLDSSAIESCVSERGLSLMKEEAAATEADGATGSPTMMINGTQTDAVYQYGNSQAYLDAICSGFNSASAECSQELATSTSASTGGSCN